VQRGFDITAGDVLFDERAQLFQLVLIFHEQLSAAGVIIVLFGVECSIGYVVMQIGTRLNLNATRVNGFVKILQ